MTLAVHLADGYGIDFMASISICKGLTWLVSCIWSELAEVDGLTLVSITLSSCLWANVLWPREDWMLNLIEERIWLEKSGFYLSLEDDELTSRLWSWKINSKQITPLTGLFFFFFFTCMTFYRISEYSHGDEIRQDEALIVPLGNLGNSNFQPVPSVLLSSHWKGAFMVLI